MNTTAPTPLRIQVDRGTPQVITVSPATLGRTPENSVAVMHPLVSRTHLAFEWTATGWTVIDRGSTNGFYHEGTRVASLQLTGPTVIRLGDADTGPLLELAPQPAARPSTPPPSAPVRPAPPPAPGPVRQGRPPSSGPMRQGPPPSHPVPAQRPAGPAPDRRLPATAGPGAQELAQAPHLAALHQNVSAVFQVPGHLRGRESIALTGVQTIGRTPDNDIVVSDVLASRRHARLSTGPQGLVIEDLGSVNGTFVNGQRISRRGLTDNDIVTIGNSDFVVSGGTLLRGQAKAVVSGGLEVDAVGLTVDGGKQLLQDVTFQSGPGTLTAIIGPSGAGKSTVSKIAAGLNSPTSGLVRFEGRGVHDEYEALRTRIGMVPQDDVLHRKLTVRQALRYAAELRLPADLSTADRDQVIDGVLAELGLTDHVDTRIDKLSGGQRKRASVAMELLTGPSLLILDEPTSGLDPALDKQVMQTLRNLADAGRVVLVVTHSVANLGLCDQVLMLAPGGRTVFCDDPRKRRAELGTDDWAELFARAAEQPEQMFAAYRARHPHQPAPPAPPAGPPVVVHPASAVRQTSTVARRQVRLIFSDRGYLAFLLAMPIVLGLLTLVIPGSDGFATKILNPALPPGAVPDDPTEGLQLLVVLVIGAVFMGTALTVRDLVGERAIFERERAVGLRPSAYLGAKIVVFFVLAIVQAAIMIGLTFALRAMPDAGEMGDGLGKDGPAWPPAPMLFVAIAVLACVSTLVGLAISAAVRSNEQTMPPLVIVVMVQMVFCGGLFPISTEGAKQLAWLFPSYWGYATAAQAVNLPVTAEQGRAPQVQPVDDGDQNSPILYSIWEPTVANAALAYGVLLLMSVLLILFIYSRLRLKRR